MALGLWAAVGSGGAAFGPLAVSCWSISTGVGVLINVPIVLVVIAINAKWCRASPRAANSRSISRRRSF